MNQSPGQAHFDLSEIVKDFIFRDRRIADYQQFRIRILFDESASLRRLAEVGNTTGTMRIEKGDESDFHGFLAAEIRNTVHVGYKSFLHSPIKNGDKTIGYITFDSLEKVNYQENDIARIKILSALIGYEILHLRQKRSFSTTLSQNLGRVFRATRKELGLSQAELAGRIKTSRIALSRWETGSQPPSRGPLFRWATELGILAGGKRSLITVVDATPRLLEIIKHEPARLDDLTPDQFELVVADRLSCMGYDVQRTGKSTMKDGGIDIIALPRMRDVASFLLAVQVKHHSRGASTGRGAVDRLLAWQNTVFRLGLLVTNTRFTRDAIWTATSGDARNFLRLRDFEDLKRWLQGVYHSEMDWKEIPESIELAPGVSVQVPKPKFSEANIVWPFKL
ncbi:MAG: helix-turn-helix domain-containing protein [Candidatus Glassbacteria bacterium]|nr:helix-turn-helix domain-containing protein [Candidatus Glassbacteria bacterium]